MVVDGEATQLKWSTMDQREKASQGRGGAYHHRNRKTGRRTQLDCKIKEVQMCNHFVLSVWCNILGVLIHLTTSASS